MKLLQHGFQLLRNGQSQVCGVLQQGHALIRQVEENDGGTHHRAAADDAGVENMPDADQGEDEHLFENALEADFASNYAMFVERGSSSSWSTTTNPGKIFAVRPNTVPSATYKVSIYAIGKV